MRRDKRLLTPSSEDFLFPVQGETEEGREGEETCGNLLCATLDSAFFTSIVFLSLVTTLSVLL